MYSKCKHCGGQMVVEHFGDYGDVFNVNKDGSISKRRRRRFIYETHGEEPLFYCIDCRTPGGEEA